MSEGGFTRLMALAGMEKVRMAVACACASAGTVMAIAPFLLAAILLVHPSPGIMVLFAICLVAQPVAMGLATGIAHHAAFNVLHDIRVGLMQKMIRLPLAYFTRRQAGDLKRVLNDDVDVIELFLGHQMPDMVACLLVPLLTLLTLVAVDWRLALATIGVIPLAFGAQLVMMRGHGAKMAEYFSRIGRINGGIVEYVRGIETLKGVRGGSFFLSRLTDAIEDFRHFAEDWFHLWGIPWSFYGVIAGASPLFVVPICLWLAATGRAAPETLLFGLFAATGLGAPLVKMAIYGEITLRVLQAERKIAAVQAAVDLPALECGDATPAHNGLDVQAMTVKSDGRTLVEQVSFVVPSGRLTAIIGPSGAGKSTLLRHMMRFADPDQGCIRLGGVDLRSFSLDRLTRYMGLVSQDVFLFDDDVAANIRVGRPDASDEEVVAAARAASCLDFIARLPQGFETRLGENGQRLSGGQRQRLALARVLLADPPIVLLDEVSSFLDPCHEALVQRSINRIAGRKTTVVVSHRLDSVVHADHLVFVQAGRVLAQGTHAGLLSGCDAYARLWAIQQRNLQWDIRTVEEPA